MENKEQILAELFNLKSKVKVQQYAELLKAIPTHELINFSCYELKNRNEYETQDKSVARCGKEFLCELILKGLKSGTFRFGSVKELDVFLRENFKGKKITNGSGEKGEYKPFVVISMDKNAKLYNEYSQKNLNSDDEVIFLKYLFRNQHKIGVVEYISERDYIIATRQAITAPKEKEPEKNIANAAKFNAIVAKLEMGLKR